MLPSLVSVVLRPLINPVPDHLYRRVVEVRSPLRHPIAERRRRRCLLNDQARVGIPRHDRGAVQPSLQERRNSVDDEPSAPAMTRVAPPMLEHRKDVARERNRRGSRNQS